MNNCKVSFSLGVAMRKWWRGGLLHVCAPGPVVLQSIHAFLPPHFHIFDFIFTSISLLLPVVPSSSPLLLSFLPLYIAFRHLPPWADQRTLTFNRKCSSSALPAPWPSAEPASQLRGGRRDTEAQHRRSGEKAEGLTFSHPFLELVLVHLLVQYFRYNFPVARKFWRCSLLHRMSTRC